MVRHIISEIKDQYLLPSDFKTPWVIGFSGGKDSTVLLQLVWYALTEIPKDLLNKDVYVVCNDTLIENPVIVNYVTKVLEKIQKAARDYGLPIEVKQTTPRLEDSFWVNVVGRGYPVPNNTFRWCTDKLKIKPTSRFIAEQVGRDRRVIILIGTRRSESIQRARSIKKHEIKGKRLSKHPNQPNTFIYAPIKDLTLEEVWYIINTMSSPWGANNQELFQIYSDASADDYECPTMVTSKSHTSCGQSRFGCWTCTVVKEDKSMYGLIKSGQEWLKPLLELRKSMIDHRNVSKNRNKTRRNGQKAIKDGHNQGSYTERYRAKLLKQILNTQKEIQRTKPKLKLITNQELIAIQVIWNKDLNFNYRVSDIYNRVYNQEIEIKMNDETLRKEEDLLKNICRDDLSNYHIIRELLIVQKSKSLLNRKHGLKDNLENIIEKYLNKEENVH